MTSRSEIDQRINWITSEWETVTEIYDGNDDYNSERENGNSYSDRTIYFRDNLLEALRDAERLVEELREFFNSNKDNNYDDDPDDDEITPPRKALNETERLHERLRALIKK